MTRNELEKNFNSNVRYAAASVAVSAAATTALATVLATQWSAVSLVAGAVSVTAGLSSFVSAGFNAMRTSHRLAALELTGRDAEPEATRPETKDTGPRAWRPSHEG